MQKWEYLQKSINRGNPLFGRIGEWKKEDFSLTQLGNEGWELVSLTPISSAFAWPGFTDEVIFTFKRPIEDPR